MTAPAKILVLDSDPRAAAALALCIQKEGAVAAPLPLSMAAPDCVALVEAGAEVLVLADHAEGAAAAAPTTEGLVARIGSLRAACAAHGRSVTVLAVVADAAGPMRAACLAAGAAECLAHPLHARDVAIVASQLALRNGAPLPWAGLLSETASVFALLRGLAALRRSGVLVFLRGLRRGEIRLFEGDITSAQVGLAHGQAALHQLLLWTDARYEFRREDVVRRQQIPMSNADVFAECRRFLDRMSEAFGELAPTDVFERDESNIAGLDASVPKSVTELFRLFDGNRSLADVLEDAPYRQFETLRVAARAIAAGLLRRTDLDRPSPTWRPQHPLETWLLGRERHVLVADGGRRGRKSTMDPGFEPSGPLTWEQLTPREASIEIEPVSQVVPVVATAGEISTDERVPQRLTSVNDGIVTPAVMVSSAAMAAQVDASTDAAGEITARKREPSTPQPTEPAVLIADALSASADVQRTQRAATKSGAKKHGKKSKAQHKANVPEVARAAEAATPNANLPATAAAAAVNAVVQPVSAVRPAEQDQPLAVERTVADATALAAAFTADEERFFAGSAQLAAPVRVEVDTFAELDEGYQPTTFWGKLAGKRKPTGES